jgi:hypothetical protein
MRKDKWVRAAALALWLVTKLRMFSQNKGQSKLCPSPLPRTGVGGICHVFCLLMLGRMYYSVMLLTDLVEGVTLCHGHPWTTLRSRSAFKEGPHIIQKCESSLPILWNSESCIRLAILVLQILIDPFS